MTSSGPKRLVPPGPPAAFDGIDLTTVRPLQVEVFRLTRSRFHSPLYFNRGGDYRFDSPSAPWGVCYFGHGILTGFLEIFADRIRKEGRINYAELDDTIAWKVKVPPDLNLLALEGATLPKIKATMQSFVSRYSLSQAWGEAFMKHPADLDGVIYKGRRSAGDCLALFGDTDPAKGRRHQRSLVPTKLGRITEWSEFYEVILQTGARVANLPTTRPGSCWS
jgi:hypothetical protein